MGPLEQCLALCRYDFIINIGYSTLLCKLFYMHIDYGAPTPQTTSQAAARARGFLPLDSAPLRILPEGSHHTPVCRTWLHGHT